MSIHIADQDESASVQDAKWSSEFAARLSECMANHSNTTIAHAAGVSSETVRRYRNGSMPTVAFIAVLAQITGTSLVWLLTGEGPRRDCDLTRWFVNKCELSDLVNELGQRLDSLQVKINLANKQVSEVNAATIEQKASSIAAAYNSRGVVTSH